MGEAKNVENKMVYEEREAKSMAGMPCLLLNIAAMIGFIVVFVMCAIALENGGANGLTVFLMVVAGLYVCLAGPVIFVGLKVLGPNEALVLTFFGVYHGTLRG
ncbi:MAG: SPFH domain-containing protein, partial [Lachnospiraceae bacterium]|nr:SPFH domain-containing protein [Lachnospiraceae bacterium]